MIVFISIFSIFFTPFLGEWLIEGKVKKENYIQSFKLCLFLFIIFSIPLFIYWLQNRGKIMPLNKSAGNMYDFITHTCNTIKGECPHGCSYCYMKRWGKRPSLHFDEKELKTDLGKGNFIFVGSSCDMFAEGVPYEWIKRTLDYCNEYSGNNYLLQTKNPDRFSSFFNELKSHFCICTTLETNRIYNSIMNNSPPPQDRALTLSWVHSIKKYITIEPIMDFDLPEFIEMIKTCNPRQVNIGADSNLKRNNLPEPPKEKILELIAELEKFTKVVQKKNLARLLK